MINKVWSRIYNREPFVLERGEILDVCTHIKKPQLDVQLKVVPLGGRGTDGDKGGRAQLFNCASLCFDFQIL